MIERLKNYLIQDREGNIYGSNPPTIAEIMYKVNEVIDYLNELELKEKESKEAK